MKVTMDGKKYECKRVVMDNDSVAILLEEDSEKRLVMKEWTQV